ncbi:MAG: recombinase family protein [Lachnospiraceae bacterium]
MARSVTVIPARSRQKANKSVPQEKKLRVAAYCRVSTDQEDQLHSFEAQVEYYTKYINEHVNYEMAGIYADEGISGTNTKKRQQFRKMIADCEAGKIDLVITKSISRFARNTQDCLMYSRKLKNLNIGIIFEKEHINTLDSTGELLFTILSSLAQDESRNISENCKWGIRTKFKNGELHLNTYKFLGYDKDENGKLVINEEQAATVRRIYNEFLWGMNPAQIAKGLEDEEVPGCLGQTRWYPSTVVGILKQEKHMGDALLQKTYTADFLTKRQVKNNGEITQVYVKDSHEGIIDKETWNAVQEEFERREKFMAAHGIDHYSYGAECIPFSTRAFCGECGHLYTRHSWKSRGVVQWQCKNHRKDGKVNCRNAHVNNADLEKGFIKAFSKLCENREKYIAGWKEREENGTPLEKIRAGQMIDITEKEPPKQFVPEMAQLVIQEITILGAKKYEFIFMEGSRIRVSV